jgi:4'-phosphopantetheinyl transferase
MLDTMSSETAPSHQRPLPKPGSLDVWRVPLDRDEESVKRWERCLSSEERSRAGRFRFKSLRNDFIVSHAAVRSILAAYLGEEPVALRYTTNPFGKPDLDDPWKGKGLRFNLSHAKSLALLAVTTARAVGVDLESYDRSLENPDELAARFFAGAERDALARVPPSDRNEAFFRLWTRKESFIKMLGSGLSMPLDRFCVSLTAEIDQALVEVDGDPEATKRFFLRPLKVSDVYAAAVATEGLIEEIRLLDWGNGTAAPQN